MVCIAHPLQLVVWDLDVQCGVVISVRVGRPSSTGSDTDVTTCFELGCAVAVSSIF